MPAKSLDEKTEELLAKLIGKSTPAVDTSLPDPMEFTFPDGHTLYEWYFHTCSFAQISNLLMKKGIFQHTGHPANNFFEKVIVNECWPEIYAESQAKTGKVSPVYTKMKKKYGFFFPYKFSTSGDPQADPKSDATFNHESAWPGADPGLFANTHNPWSKGEPLPKIEKFKIHDNKSLDWWLTNVSGAHNGDAYGVWQNMQKKTNWKKIYEAWTQATENEEYVILDLKNCMFPYGFGPDGKPYSATTYPKNMVRVEKGAQILYQADEDCWMPLDPKKGHWLLL